MKRDLINNIATVMLLEPVDAVHTDTASKILDVADCFGVEIDAMVGALTGVDAENYVTPVLQESDTTTGTDFTTVDADDIIGAFSKVDSGDEDGVIQRVGYKGTKRYLRVNFDYTGTGITAGIIGAIGVLGYPKDAPFTAPDPITAS